jgi:hypothetical protein
LLAIAQAFRGARARIRSTSGSATGRIVGVERQGEKDGYRITVLGRDGTLRIFPLDKVTALVVKDRSLELGLRKALDISLNQGSWKPVELTIHLGGAKSHDLVLSYVVEMPTWKPAYRVVFDAGDEQSDPGSAESRALLQGWAVVDNVSGEDWRKVKLSLTAGTPLTFAYDLYRPRYVRRPDLSPTEEELAVAPPPATGGAFAGGAPPSPEKSSGMDDLKSSSRPRSYGSRSRGYKKARSHYEARRNKKEVERSKQEEAPTADRDVSSADLQRSFQTLVGGSRVGSLFRYDIQSPVTIPDRQSALVSILNKQVPAEDILLFRVESSAKHPYRAVRLTNATEFVLEKGPVTIYRGGAFVGESLTDRIGTKASAFIPYALDGRVTVDVAEQTKDEDIRLFTIRNGYLTVEVKRVTIFNYQIASRLERSARLYLQRRKRDGWKLIGAPKETLDEKDYYFVPATLAQKGPTKVVVREETPVRRWVAVSSYLARRAIAIYLSSDRAEAKVSAGLKQVLALQDEIGALDRKVSDLERNKRVYSERQDEVRKNLKELGKSDRNRDLKRQLARTMSDLEQRLNELVRQLVTHRIKRGELSNRLTVLLGGITLELK